jgi:predicted DNA binding CopG/RHH family protein
MIDETETDTEIDDTEWGEPSPVAVRRNVTISVRFSADEITALRENAAAAGMKVTTLIRQAALHSGDHIDRDKVARAVDAASNDLEQIRQLIHSAAP